MKTMENAPRETAKDLFLHLLSAATLYLGVIGFITVWWQIINFLFPDKLNYIGTGTGIYMTLIRGVAMLIVAFPVFILVSWIIGRDLKANPAKRESGVRKWLWYITLFVSAITIIIDLVILIFNYLRGDLTIQFFLKLLAILVVTAVVFGYYLWDLRKRETISNRPKQFAWASGMLILASIIFGFYLVGSPEKQRDLRFDEQRVSDLQQIQSSLINYWQQKNQLPPSLGDLKTLGFNVPNDPETSQPYEYSATGDLSFKLCANFKLASLAQANDQKYSYYGQVGVATNPQGWVHGAGQICFDSTIDKAFLQNLPKPINPGISPLPAPGM